MKLHKSRRGINPGPAKGVQEAPLLLTHTWGSSSQPFQTDELWVQWYHGPWESFVQIWECGVTPPVFWGLCVQIRKGSRNQDSIIGQSMTTDQGNTYHQERGYPEWRGRPDILLHLQCSGLSMRWQKRSGRRWVTHYQKILDIARSLPGFSAPGNIPQETLPKKLKVCIVCYANTTTNTCIEPTDAGSCG